MTKMLIIQNENDFACAWRDMFANQRFLIELVEDGQQAGKQMRESHFDVIIMDTGIPSVSCRCFLKHWGGNCESFLPMQDLY